MSEIPDSIPRTQNSGPVVHPQYSVVVPCYNEQDSIVPLLDEIVTMIGGDPRFEIIVVDDCSEDETRSQLSQARDRIGPSLKLVSHAVNAGQSAAICTGIDVAKGTWIATLDGDGQNDPSDIPKLIKILNEARNESRVPIICGHRTTRRDSWVRKLSSKVANAVRSGLLNDATADTGCGLKLISREVFMRLPRFDHMHRFLPALIQRDGGYVISVAVGHRPRQAGHSKSGIHNRLWAGIIDLVGVMWLRRRKFKSTNFEEY
jgi:dolichol-phosphate mannosyltransferase